MVCLLKTDSKPYAVLKVLGTTQLLLMVKFTSSYVTQFLICYSTRSILFHRTPTIVKISFISV
jgi:hypothetical protein